MLHGFTLIWVRNFRLNDYQSVKLKRYWENVKRCEEMM